MADVTHLLDAAAAGDPRAAARLAAERPGHTLQPTALVHEAYLRPVGRGQPQDWRGRGQSFGAAAEAMPRAWLFAALTDGPGPPDRDFHFS